MLLGSLVPVVHGTCGVGVDRDGASPVGGIADAVREVAGAPPCAPGISGRAVEGTWAWFSVAVLVGKFPRVPEDCGSCGSMAATRTKTALPGFRGVPFTTTGRPPAVAMG